GDQTEVERHEERHAEGDDQVRAALHRRQELARHHNADLVHAAPSRAAAAAAGTAEEATVAAEFAAATVWTKISSSGARTTSKCSPTRPRCWICCIRSRGRAPSRRKTRLSVPWGSMWPTAGRAP